MAVFKLEILTKTGRFFEGEVESINFTSSIGKIEILPNHITYMSEILQCNLSVKQRGVIKNAAVTDGIVYFNNSTASVLVETAKWVDEVGTEKIS